MKTLGQDRSKWQGQTTAEQIAMQVAQNIRFVYCKATQGSGHQDYTYVDNVRGYKESIILPGPYHFTTNDNAVLQFNNFISQIEAGPEIDLPPAMDCEAYTALKGEPISLRELRYIVNSSRLYGLLGIEPASVRMLKLAAPNEFLFALVVRIQYGLTYPSMAVIDSLGRKLEAWMATQPKIRSYIYPAIYTNASSGNKIFGTTTAMNRYLLWVANWRTPVPTLPKIWFGKPYYVWQYDVVDGAPYGIDGQVDLDQWGDQFPFPGDEPEPPPPTEDYFDVVATHADGRIYTGRVNRG